MQGWSAVFMALSVLTLDLTVDLTVDLTFGGRRSGFSLSVHAACAGSCTEGKQGTLIS